MINFIIKETLTKELNNIKEVKSKSEDLIKVESEEDEDWLENNYKITLLYRKFKIKNQKVNVIIDTKASTNIITKNLLEKLNIKIKKSSNKIFNLANRKDIIAFKKLILILKFRKRNYWLNYK